MDEAHGPGHGLEVALVLEQASVDDGEVTLSGHTPRKTTALAAVGLTEAVTGVTGVVNRLTFDTDDTPARPANHRANHDPTRGLRNSHGLPTHAEQFTRTEATR